MTDTLFAFYGSLRAGMYNHKLFEPHMEFIRSVRIKGYKLYALTDYPYAVRTDNMEDSIMVEIYRVTSNNTMEAIDKLELDAGYIREELKVEGRIVIIYTFEKVANNVEVPGGDWVEFFGK